MKIKYVFFFAIITVVIFIAISAAWEPVLSSVEQPKYALVQHDGAIEIRDYGPMIIAEAEMTGDQKEAINKGFRLIADYIFGNNISSVKVAMTAPVIQEASEKIQMTAPVTQQGDGVGGGGKCIL